MLRGGLRAAALLHHHARHIALDDVGDFVQVDEGHGRELGRGAALSKRSRGPVPPHLLQHLRVKVGEGVRCPEHTGTRAFAVVGMVASGGDDPVVPPQFSEGYIKILLAAHFCVFITLKGAT